MLFPYFGQEHIASEDITTHYSIAGIGKLIELANRVCVRKEDISVASFLKQLNKNAENAVLSSDSSMVSKVITMNKAFGNSRKISQETLQKEYEY